MAFPIFEKQADIPLGYESEYEEKDGKWVARVPDVGKLESTLEKVRAEKKDAEKATREAQEKAADIQRQLDIKATAGADVDKKMAAALEKWEKDKESAVKAVQDQLDAVTGKLRAVNLDDRAKAAFLKAGGRPERADAALKLKRDRLDLVDDRLVVKDEKGEVTTETVDDLFAKSFRKEMPDFYKGTQAKGGGAAGIQGAALDDGADADAILKNPRSALQAAHEAGASA